MIIPDTKKNQKHRNDEINSRLYICIGLLLIVLFIFLQPKISARIFPQKRHMLLDNFISTTKKDNNINPKIYWEFREFYSPGYFDFSKEGIAKNTLTKTDNSLTINYNSSAVERVFLLYHSPKLFSYDMLVGNYSLDDIIPKKNYQHKDILIQNQKSIMYKEDSNTIISIFLTSIDEMEKANGFFDYQDIDKELLRDKKWLNITQINFD